MKTKKYSYMNYPYPENIFMAIKGDDSDVEYTSEIGERTIEVLSVLFNDTRRMEIMDMRFKYHMSFDEISQKFQITKERIRQICDLGLRRLKLPRRLEYIKTGIYPGLDEKFWVINDEIKINFLKNYFNDNSNDTSFRTKSYLMQIQIICKENNINNFGEIINLSKDEFEDIFDNRCIDLIIKIFEKLNITNKFESITNYWWKL